MSEIGRQIVALHREGVQSLAIAHRLGVAQSTVHYHLRKAMEPGSKKRGGKRSGPRAGPARTRQQVAALLAQGVDRAEIARRLGLAKSCVSYHARQLGAKMDDRFARRYDWGCSASVL